MAEAQGRAPRPGTGQQPGSTGASTGTGSRATKGVSPSAAKAAIRRKKETYTIGFRVDAYTLSQLEKGAAIYGLSVHEYARQRLLELLERRDEARVLEASERTQQGVEALRSDVATTLEVILLNFTTGSPAHIRDWIDTHLRNSETDEVRDDELSHAPTNQPADKTADSAPYGRVVGNG